MSLGIPPQPPDVPPQVVHRRKVKEHPTRNLILNLLSERAGATITDLCRAVGAGWGTVQHHLYLLRRAGLVKSVMQGRTHVFFGENATLTTLQQQAVLLRGRVRELVTIVLRQPGIGQLELTQRISMSRKVLRAYVELLTTHGLLEERRRSKYREYFPTPALLSLAASIVGSTAFPASSEQPATSSAATPTTPLWAGSLSP